MPPSVSRAFLLAMLAALVGFSSSAAASFVAFESGQTRPLAMSPDGTRLFALNTPDNRLEIFDVVGGTLSHSESVPVGMEPVAVAVRSNGQVWVVNHLSDSVSIVDVSVSPARVVRTLLVGDEPRDIVIANGTVGERVMITTARRGQNSANHSTDPVDPLQTLQGVGRALVWIFDPNNLGTNLEGNPLSIVTLFGDIPRALTVSPDGNTVYASIFHSGNRTTAIFEGLVCNNFTSNPCIIGGQQMPGGVPPPSTNFQGITAPKVGLILKFNPVAGQWQDELGRNWNNAVPFSLPDLDVFEISTTSGAVLNSYPGVGTINFNMATNPVSGKVYVSNTEAINEVRFEGHGVFAANFKPPGVPSTVRGHLHEARITVLDGVSILPRHLNKHIDYDVHPSPPGVKEHSLATPLDMAVSSDGSTLYVAAFGSSKVGVFDTTQLESNTFTPSSASHIPVSGGGPTGVVLDENNDRLYVLTRFDNSISVIDTTTNTEIDHMPVYNPEPVNVVEGRPFLYDAFNTSSNGEASCSSCHVFGDLDSLAWDLGDPDEVVIPNPNPFTVGSGAPFHPMKGPMTTQSLRGMDHHGPMHWRGDRTGGNDPGGNALDEVQAFLKFNPAFGGLVGLGNPPHDQIPMADMLKFANFILDVTYPPNPIRALDNSMTAEQAAGLALYNGRITDIVQNCNGCHTLNAGQGFFGGNGGSSIEGEPQEFKIPHLRNAYQKIGMFSTSGPQIRGFGFLHDGSVDTLNTFLSAAVFQINNTERRNLEALTLAFPTTFAPIVGQQITLNNTNAAVVGPRITLMIQRASTPFALVGMPGARECDLVVKGTVAGEPRGALYNSGSGLFITDRASDPALTDAQLRALAATPGQQLTYTCAPPGTGMRMALDRDEDGYFDMDEIDAGSDPADPNSIPGTPTVTPTPSNTPTPSDTPTPGAPPACGSGSTINGALLRVARNDSPAGDERLVINGDFVLVSAFPPVDPSSFGLTFEILDSTNNSALVSRVVPAGLSAGGMAPGWRVNRAGTRWRFSDRANSLGLGITSVVLTDRSNKTPGLFSVRIRGKNSNFQVMQTDLTLVVTPGGGLSQCASRNFNPSSGPPPRCELRGATSRTLLCK